MGGAAYSTLIRALSQSTTFPKDQAIQEGLAIQAIRQSALLALLNVCDLLLSGMQRLL